MPKAQVEVTFNWIYVLIAGGVILFFFFGLVLRQKETSEERLGADLVTTLKSIFVGAGAAEKTKNFISTGGLSEYTLYFQCDNKLSTFGIEGTSTRAEDAITPIFTPSFIKSSQLIAWSLPYKLPYKVTDLLMVTAPTTKYYLIGDQDFAQEFLNATDKFNREIVSLGEHDQINPEQNFEVRIVDLDGNVIVPGDKVPTLLQVMDDDKVTGVSFQGERVIYYQKQSDTWKKLHINPLSIVSLGGEKDAAKYAAIFAGNDQLYQCNMQKAFQRLRFLTEVYYGKTRELVSYYESHPELLQSGNCLVYLKTSPNNLDMNLKSYLGAAQACSIDSDRCANLITQARVIEKLNDNLQAEGCITLY